MSIDLFGEDSQNNQVIIDYAKREVWFKPISTIPLWRLYTMFLGNLLELSFVKVVPRFCAVWAMVLLGCLLMAWGAFGWLVVKLGVSVLVLFWALLFGLSLEFWVGDWRREKFPAYNALFCRLAGEEESLVVNPEAVIDRRFLLPCFQNIGLSWAATGDFSFYLERVEVRSHFASDEASWFALFTFSEQPVEGSLRIKYI